MKDAVGFLVKRIAKLTTVKSIVTLALTVVFCVQTIRGQTDGLDFKTIFLMVIAYHFGTQSSIGSSGGDLNE